MHKATQDQIAAVMLKVGTDKQKEEALEYCGIIKNALKNLRVKVQQIKDETDWDNLNPGRPMEKSIEIQAELTRCLMRIDKEIEKRETSPGNPIDPTERCG